MSSPLARVLARSAARSASSARVVSAARCSFSSSARTFEPSYTASAKASGAGRNGKVELTNGKEVVFKLAMPKELGGTGDGENPERLFASGYASCFLSALQLVAREAKIKLPEDLAIHADVTIAKGDDGFALSAVLTGKSDKMPKDELKKLLHEAHKVCPYSKATRNNMPVELKVAS
ncbi:unnamed protein product [Tilletia controversa]|uniref:Organic hydroperoxide resistance protein n=3 Tax=Tilletia TaxID=13289 RepID=A0A8X7T0K3_9BASI|nr:hypothetical protein CF336_g480 [Tilletia laevis]KAE8203219.1 hypothetical protein CF328_g1764 [Tilletia controversa]KAE8265415.1 hypothetical protein A4X03_0g289 [Tilletia caries]KAE8208790.1 hypothetical protein CF335_g158 [Tilletia laevis]KAE8255251.1 hypothetical protein A4X06_0g527 [Tilletia controversa]